MKTNTISCFVLDLSRKKIYISVCELQSPRSDCASAQSDLGLCFSPTETTKTIHFVEIDLKGTDAEFDLYLSKLSPLCVRDVSGVKLEYPT